MKIIHVAYAPQAYGISAFLLSLIQFQKEKYKDQNLAIGFHAENRRIEKFAEIGIPLYCLGRKSARDLRILFDFYRIYKKYDIVNFHTHSPWAFLAALFAKKKTIFTFHGALGLKNNWIDLIIKVYYRSIIHRYCDRITFASASSFERYISAIGGKLNMEKIRIFPYGIMLETIRAAKSKKEVRKELELDECFVVGTAARIDREKRLERLIEAFAFLVTENKLNLIIAGNGNKEYENFLRNLATKLNIDKMVHFLGYREDIFEIINSFDLFVLPSRNEPFGLALLEAMILGIPCAVFKDGGGAVDIIGDSGFIVGNSEELAKVILKVKENETLREEVSQRGKERAMKFDIKFSAQKFHSTYCELMNK